MRGIKKIGRLVLIIGIFIIACIFIFKNKFSKELSVEKWNNIYNENNINFFYDDGDNDKIKILNYNYSLEENINDEKDIVKKAIKVSELLSEIITFDDIPSSNKINGFDILKEKNGSKKASARDLGIIYRDFLKSLGYTARVGEFKRTNVSFSKEKSYYVVEFWSKEYNKWIMIDFIDRGYFNNKGFPCSAMDLLDVDIRNLEYTGNSKRSDYIPMLKKTLYTYTISIDNTVTMEKSNTYITYIKDEDYIGLKFKGSFLPPTIFTENKELMSKNPIENSVLEDNRAYIILMKKEESNEEESKANSFIIGAFKNGKILDEYYISENEEDFVKIKKYKDILITEGKNTIELSLDGKEVISSIEIKY